jgi:hypothetical protein
MDGSGTDIRRSRARWFLTGLAGLIVAIPIVAAVLIGTPNVSAQSSGLVSGATRYTPVGLAGASQASTPGLPASLSATPHGVSLPPGNGILNAIVRHRTQLRATPGGHVIATMPVQTEFGSPEVLPVVKFTRTSLGVISTLAGNGHLGWLPVSDVTLSRNVWRIKVSIGSRSLTVYEDGKAIHRTTVAVGAAYAPTPTGHFAVTDRLHTGDPTGPYGCCILALSAHAPHAIQGWYGGNRIAIHSTPETASIGQPDSHGCIRVTLPEGRWLLARVPLGTPVDISS